MAIKIFTEVAHYLNAMNKNCMTPTEVKSAIHDYFAEYESCKSNGKKSSVIDGIFQSLADDNSFEARLFEEKIKTLLPQYAN